METNNKGLSPEEAIKNISENAKLAEGKNKEIMEAIELFKQKMMPLKSKELTVNGKRCIVTLTKQGVVYKAFADSNDAEKEYDSFIQLHS